MGVNTTVVPVVSARQGLGGWIEMIARLRKAQRKGGPGGIMKVSMVTTDVPHFSGGLSRRLRLLRVGAVG